jgi:hypothetical protein
MQKLFGGGVQSGIQRGADLIAPKGLMAGRQWAEHVANLRASGKGEGDVRNWAMANISKIKEFQSQDPAMTEWIVRQKKALETQYFGEGYARQRMREVQATTLNADIVTAETKEQTQILTRLEEQGALRAEFERQYLLSVQNTNAQMRLMDEAESTNATFKRIEVQVPIVRRCY